MHHPQAALPEIDMLTNSLASNNLMIETEFLSILGKRIKSLRINKKIKQCELAALCDFEKASMSRIEAGITNTTIFTLRKISMALEVHISELLKD